MFNQHPYIDIITTFNYSTVVNNSETKNNHIIFFDGNTLMDSCNIINNTNSKGMPFGLIQHYSRSFTIKSCSFLNNIFREGGWLIYNAGDQLTVDNCYFDDTVSSTFLYSVETLNPRELFTNNLSHLLTDCEARSPTIHQTIKVENKFPLNIISIVNIYRS